MLKGGGDPHTNSGPFPVPVSYVNSNVQASQNSRQHVTDRFGAYNPERNPTNFGPVLRPIVWAVNELQYQLLGLKPLANAAPLGSRGPVLIGAVAPFGNPVSFAVSAAPARGAVSAAGGGLFFYTPAGAFVAAGGKA